MDRRLQRALSRACRTIWLTLAGLAVLLAVAAIGGARAAENPCGDRDGGVGGTGVIAPQDAARGGAAAQPGGVGGTGRPAPPSARSDASARGGVGGTGIVGTITGFASVVCVNGIEVHYDDNTPVTINGRPGTAAQLALGQVVAVEAWLEARGLTARRIAILNALEGPVTRSDPAARTLFVMGQPVRVTDATQGAVSGQRLESVASGAQVQVSGYRTARGELVASRIDLAPTLREQSVIGRITRVDGRDGELDGLPVSTEGARLRADREVLVRGRWDGERLRVRDLSDDPSTLLIGRVGRLIIESLVRAPKRDDSLRVGKFQVRIGRGTRIDGKPDELTTDQRVRVTGVPDRQGGIAAERIEILRAGRARPDAGRSDQGGAAERAGAGQAGHGGGRTDNPGPGRVERTERSGDSGSDRAERPERVDNSGSGRVDRPERVDNSGSGRVDRPERVERPDGGRRGRD